METLSFQAPLKMKQRLDALAREMDRSKGYLIRQALEEYLENLADLMETRRYKASHDSRNNLSLADIKRKYKLK